MSAGIPWKGGEDRTKVTARRRWLSVSLEEDFGERQSNFKCK